MTKFNNRSRCPLHTLSYEFHSAYLYKTCKVVYLSNQQFFAIIQQLFNALYREFSKKKKNTDIVNYKID